MADFPNGMIDNMYHCTVADISYSDETNISGAIDAKLRQILSDWFWYIHWSFWATYLDPLHSDLDCRIVSKKDFKTSLLGQEYLIA